MIQRAALLDHHLNVTVVIIGVNCRSRVGRGCGNIKRKLHLLKKNTRVEMSSLIAAGHLSCTLQMAEEKGFLWERAEDA